MPPKAPMEAYKFWVTTLNNVCNSESWNNILLQYALDEFCLIGEEFENIL